MQPLSNAEAGQTRAWLETIGSSLQSAEFAAWNLEWLAAHCDAFDEAEENKLEYTQAHERYQVEVEKHINAAVAGTDVDMSKLLERLPAFLKQTTDAAQMSPASAECVETLTSLTEFNEFKAAMIMTKRDKASSSGAGAPAAGGELFEATAAHSLRDMEGCLEFAAAMDAATDGWTTLSDKGWFRLEKRPAPGATNKGDAVTRYRMELDLPLDDVAVMLTDYSGRRALWDDTFKSSTLVQQHAHNEQRDDRTVTVQMKFHYLMRLVGVPSEMSLRIVVLHDTPDKVVPSTQRPSSSRWHWGS
ncbi:hypothetical protein T492DRAFT_25046 [Pavlovales sp. CCMP2436]|nr:hypothetical protein T492DRAFT_25046 [Pavlovales sp. CCMP2436]